MAYFVIAFVIFKRHIPARFQLSISGFQMFDYLFSAGILVHLALLFYALGFLFRDELILRVLLLTGTIFYLLYYYYAAETPLWDAIYTSGILFIINTAMILIIIRERTKLALSGDEAALFSIFKTLTPGQFRKIMKIATWHEPQENQTILTENVKSEKLYFSMPGKVQMEKEGSVFTTQGNMFIGEIGFMLNEPASATVTVLPGTKYVEWDAQKLKTMMQKSQPLENAFKAMFNFDLARKVSRSFGKSDV